MARYLDVLKPILLAALDNHREYQVPLFHWSPSQHAHQSCRLAQVCSAAVGLVGDLFRVLTINMIPHCDDIMGRLITNLGVCAVLHSPHPSILLAN